MAFALSLFSGRLLQKQAADEVLECNRQTEQFGLVLTQQQALALVNTRTDALKKTGRIEFGRGAIGQIIDQFCNSPFLDSYCYEETLHALIDIFYDYKNETMDRIGDDDLIRYMKHSFDGICQGSLELLAGRELYRLAQNLQYGRAPDAPEDGEDAAPCPAEEDENGEY